MRTDPEGGKRPYPRDEEIKKSKRKTCVIISKQFLRFSWRLAVIDCGAKSAVSHTVLLHSAVRKSDFLERVEKTKSLGVRISLHSLCPCASQEVTTEKSFPTYQKRKNTK